MKLLKHLLLAAALLAPVASFAGQADASDLKGQFKFTSNAPKEDIFGTADGSAQLTVDLNDLTTLKGTITVPVASMKTGNEVRDEHMQSPDWLDAKGHPNITFEVISVTASPATEKDGFKESTLQVKGKFTLRGVTTELTAPATLKWKDDGKAKITTQFTLKLADYKVVGKNGVVGSKVGESIKCEATLTGSLK